jgi:hypothetical protein
LPLPADSSQRATEILASSSGRAPRRWTGRRAAAIAALVAAGLAGLVLALVLSNGGSSSHTSSTPQAVAPPQTGSNATEQARNFAVWLRSH